MRCPICNETDKWKNVDEHRLVEKGMSLCGNCGFVSYPEKYKTKEEIKKYYETEYRQIPSTKNIFTGERKLNYHGHFLKDTFEAWRGEKRDNLVVTDIGSAIGMFLNWVKGIFPNADLVGVELTKTYARNAWHLFNIKTIGEFDDSKKYDLISSYKSLEHILDPDVELKRYIDALKDDGYLYLGVPIWFETLKNFGVGNGFDIEYYYSPDHINTWSRKHVEGLIKVCGGEVVKENRTYYDTVYLIKKSQAVAAERQVCYEDPNAVLENLGKIKLANTKLIDKQFKDAIDIWPNFPVAWMTSYEFGRKEYHAMGFEWIYENLCQKGIKACPDASEMHFFAADICARYDRYELAIEHLRLCNDMTPNMPNVYSLLASCFRTMANRAKTEDDKQKFFEQSRKSATLLKSMSVQTFTEAMNWIMFDNSHMPTPFE